MALMPLLLVTHLFDQGRKISGKVIDNNGNPLLGVSITVRGDKAAAVSDSTGKFDLTINNPTSTVLVFSSVGFKEMQARVSNKTDLSIVMESQVSSLDDVVVVGYGT